MKSLLKKSLNLYKVQTVAFFFQKFLFLKIIIKIP